MHYKENCEESQRENILKLVIRGVLSRINDFKIRKLPFFPLALLMNIKRKAGVSILLYQSFEKRIQGSKLVSGL